jgi:hypothetical protein
VPRFKAFLLNVLTVAVSIGLTLLAAEIVLRFLPVATALPVEPPTAENPIQRYVANHPSTWSFGWKMDYVVRGRSNAQGFLADYDYDAADRRPLVAVVGDSYIEALRVPFAQSVTGRLQAALGHRGRAYAFAQSGAPLSQYVAYAQHACTAYRPARMVVNVVGNDFDQSVFAHRLRNGYFHLYPRPDGGFDHRLTPLPAPGLVERILRRSTLALYLMRNVGISDLIARMGINMAQAEIQPARRHVCQTDADARSARVEEGYRVIDWFLGALPQAACLSASDIVIVVDAPRPEVYDAGARAGAQTSYCGRMRSRLIEQAKTRGFRVIDTEPHFVAAHAADGKRFEHPIDGHWNSHGHEIVAAAVLATLSDWAPALAAVEGR